jgi:hypothetical protein
MTDEEIIKKAAALIGARKSERKSAAARANGFEPGHPYGGRGGEKPKPLFDSPCNCGAGDVIEGHKSKCPRYHLIFKRRKNHLDLMTGKPLAEGSDLRLESPSQVAA